MTVQQDVKRAGLRTMMAESMLGVPEYSADPKVVSRVGNVIGETASQEERHVRATGSVSARSRVDDLRQQPSPACVNCGQPMRRRGSADSPQTPAPFSCQPCGVTIFESGKRAE
jgi:hypothetical protein